MVAQQLTDGSVFSHVTIGTADIARATVFYDRVLAPLNMERVKSYKIAIGYAPKGFAGINAPFWVLRPYDRKAASAGNGVTVAFTAPSRRAVDDFFAAAMASGGSEEGGARDPCPLSRELLRHLCSRSRRQQDLRRLSRAPVISGRAKASR